MSHPTKTETAHGSHLNLADGTGKAGEAAADYILRQNGYEIVRSNYRVRSGEIDLIAHHHDQIVFVEVKTRRSRSFGYPEEALTPTKIRRLKESAQAYLEETGAESSDWRIDLLAVEMDSTGKVRRFNLVENAVSEDSFG